ncbi:hypothetical protein KUCAC02_001450, partial [Chaenocephalus aceratus]
QPVQSNVGGQQIDKQPTQPVRSSRLKPRAEEAEVEVSLSSVSVCRHIFTLRMLSQESFWPRAGSDNGAKTKTEQTHLDSAVNEQEWKREMKRAMPCSVFYKYREYRRATDCNTGNPSISPCCLQAAVMCAKASTKTHCITAPDVTSTLPH